VASLVGCVVGTVASLVGGGTVASLVGGVVDTVGGVCHIFVNLKIGTIDMCTFMQNVSIPSTTNVPYVECSA
jgi:uncharacterized membrane protein